MKKLTTVLGNSQRLDGGAMFGNAPKVMWNQWIEADENNQIPLSSRCLLVEDDQKLILFETGVGAFFEPKLRERFGVQESAHVLLENLGKLGVSHEDIDFVVLSHLHFDHAGGALSAWEEDSASTLLFPNARFVVGKDHWQRALKSHARDRASFVPEIINHFEAIYERLVFIDGPVCSALGNDYLFHLSDGHTPGLLVTEIKTEDVPYFYMTDLIPGAPWVHLPITMGYDRYPEKVINEKTQLLKSVAEQEGRIVFCHDPKIASSQVEFNGKRYVLKNPVEEKAIAVG